MLIPADLIQDLYLAQLLLLRPDQCIITFVAALSSDLAAAKL